MNERIREPYYSLMYKASEGWNDHLFQVPPELLEKFAELIVQECIHALWTEECRINAMTQADYERSGNRIHKHFYGVEE